MNKLSIRVLSVLLPIVLAACPLLAQETETRTTPDGRFAVEVELGRLPVLSQDATGTCWSFATISYLESELERIHGRVFDLSEMFPVYHAYLEKARRYVRFHGKAQFSEGGLCHDVIEMVRHHGMLPNEAFTGLCDGRSRHDHAEMSALIGVVLEKLAAEKKPSDRWEEAIRGILEAYLGKPPRTVTVEGRELTARQYADEVLQLPYDDYVEIMSYSYAPFWKEAELMVPDNWMRWQRYLNVPADVMMDALDHALDNGFSVAIDMDVSERGFKVGDGTASLGTRLEKPGAITQEMRDEDFANRETTDDHLMHVVGRARDQDGRVWYLTKNSWGPVGPYGGNLFMSRNYVALKSLSYMVHKDGLPDAVREKVRP